MALAAILLWYFGIGVLAAIGTVTIGRARFSPRFEHIFFALLLIPIAAMYLAFVEYFGDHSALRLEVYGVALFAGLALSGLRLPALLMVLSAIGFGFTLYLTYLELFVIHAICRWCVGSAVIISLIFIVTILDWQQRRTRAADSSGVPTAL